MTDEIFHSASLLSHILSEASGMSISPGAIERVPELESNADVADSTTKFKVVLPGYDRGFLIVSGPGNPDLVARAARNIAHARKVVSPSCARSILEPLSTGSIVGLSFAMWPARPPLLGGGRISNFIARQRYSGRVIDWLVEFARSSATEADTNRVMNDLGHVAANLSLPKDMRRDAERA